MLSSIFFKPNTPQQVSHPLIKTQKRKYLVLGCGYKDHQDIHPKTSWLSIDINQAVYPDLVADVRDTTLKSQLSAHHFLPKLGFDLIYSEYLPLNTYNDSFIKNVDALLNENGLFITKNLSPAYLTQFTSYFPYSYIANCYIILSKKSLTIDEILKKIESLKLDNTISKGLIPHLQKQANFCKKENITEPLMQMAAAAYLYLRCYQQIIKPIDIDLLLHQFFSPLTLSDFYQRIPDAKSIIEPHPAVKKFLESNPSLLIILTSNDLKDLTQLNVAKMSEEETQEFVLYALEKFTPKGYELNNTDEDTKAYLMQRNEDIILKKDPHKWQKWYTQHQSQPGFDKTILDVVIDRFADRFLKAIHAQDIGGLLEIQNSMLYFLEDKTSIINSTLYDSDLYRGYVESLCVQQAKFILETSLSITSNLANYFIKEAVKETSTRFNHLRL